MDHTQIEEMYRRAVDFHGHECPGLTIGLRAAELCLREFGHNREVPITAVVETDMCGVDAIQALTGCTLGKGNLIHRDRGKMAFSFYRKSDGRGLRALLRPEARPLDPRMLELMRKEGEGQATDEDRREMQAMRVRAMRTIRELPLDELFMLSEPAEPLPRGPRILESLRCESCGEMTMESRTRRFAGKALCIPCFDAVEQKR